MNKKKSRFLITLLAAMLCMTAFSSAAYAASEEAASAPTATSTPSPNPFTPDGTGTVLDNATDEDGKEFFSIITPNEHVFYLIIDRQRNTENVYFLDAVTEKDLLALVETTEDAESIISSPTPEPTPEPTPQPEQKSVPESQNNTGGIVAIVLTVAVIAGGAFLFFQLRKPKQSVKGKSDLNEYDFGEDEDEPDDAGNSTQEADAETGDDEQ